jgi:hypothetical protein
VTAFASAYGYPAAVLHNRGVVEVQSGTLQLNGNGTHSGGFAVATNATLTFAGGTHSVTNGIAFSGLGTVRFQTALQRGAEVDFGTLNVIFEGSASISGAYGMSNAADGTITLNKSMTIPGSAKIAGTLVLANSGLTVTISGTFILEATGVLNNPGTLRVGAFVNNGGTVNGNAPVVIGLSPSSLRINTVRFERGPASTEAAMQNARPTLQVVITWQAADSWGTVVESSRDLKHWSEQPSAVREVSPGSFEAVVSNIADTQCFFRLKRLSP